MGADEWTYLVCFISLTTNTKSRPPVVLLLYLFFLKWSKHEIPNLTDANGRVYLVCCLSWRKVHTRERKGVLIECIFLLGNRTSKIYRINHSSPRIVSFSYHFCFAKLALWAISAVEEASLGRKAAEQSKQSRSMSINESLLTQIKNY